MKGIGLFILSIILAMISFPAGISYTLIRLLINAVLNVNKYISRYFYTCAISIDQLGNVLLMDLINDLLIQKDGYKFGNPDETISSVLGKNEESNTLKPLGIKVARKLNQIDKDHTKKSIETDER